MYERQFSSRFSQSNRFRSAFRFGGWFVLVVACFVALFSCGVYRYAVFRFQTDSDAFAYPDTRVIVDIYPSDYRDTVYFRSKFSDRK